MKTTIEIPKRNSLLCSSTAPPRPHSLSLKIGTLLAAFVFLLFGTTQVRAHSSPPGCTGSGLGILLFTDSPDVHIGDTLNYSITVFNGTGNGPVVCDATAIQAFVVTPDLVSHPITVLRTNMFKGQPDYYQTVDSYDARAQDSRPDG